ncbi:MAG: site-2 protease family protein [Elusimicrobia bacterium]|nr:site-2 protease family protein [Elusimicrobiota bacterium]
MSFSAIVHELAHGWTAFARGDRTAEAQGRLTLNPVPHFDPFGTVFLPLLCSALRLPMFGWARPMPLDASRLSSPRDVILVAAAGPCASLGLALVLALTFKLAGSLGPLAPEFQKTLLEALRAGITINLALAAVNLLPVHPLDGSRVLAGLLPAPWRERYERHIPYASYVLLGLLAARLIDPFFVGPSQAAIAGLARAGLVW